MIFVYGIVAEGYEIPAELRGVGDPPRPLRLVRHEGLGAVVADLDAPPSRREDLEAHVTAMGALAEAGTIVPMRFGTVTDDEQELRTDLLDRYRDHLQQVLQGLDGCVQMTIRAIYDENVPLREIVQRNPELKSESERLKGQAQHTERDALIRLGERVASAVEQVRASDEQQIAERVAQVAEHVVVEPPGHERIATRLQVLVRRDRREQLDELVRSLGEEQRERMTLRYSGPIAPYSFSDFNLDAEAPAWA
jgi:Gas vesicle synthesis protein GvpL/GvpF